jgi:hypothetical protein
MFAKAVPGNNDLNTSPVLSKKNATCTIMGGQRKKGGGTHEHSGRTQKRERGEREF